MLNRFGQLVTFEDPVSALIGGGASIIGGLLGSDSASTAAQQQAAGQANSAAIQQAMFNTVNEQQKPWRDAGYNALSALYPGGNATDKTLGGALDTYYTHQFGPEDLKTNLAPNYQFMLDQGLGALRNQMNTTGGQVSGNLLKGINDYAQNYASNAYQQAFQNYTANQSNIFNRLASIAGLGQTANQATGQAATAAGQGIGSAYGNAGSALAGGTVGSTNALTGGLGNAASWYGLSNFLKQPNNGSLPWDAPAFNGFDPWADAASVPWSGGGALGMGSFDSLVGGGGIA